MSDTHGNSGGNTSGGNYSGSNYTWRNDPSARAAPNAFDPWLQPELFRGTLTKRFFAFLIDLVVLTIPVVLLTIFIAVFGIVTLGLGWFLFSLISPFAVIWALVYYGASLGGANSATVGMRLMDVEMRTRDGGRPYFLLGVIHAVLYWASVSFLTPLIALVGLFNGRRQLLHDLVLGTVVINRSATMPVAQPGPRV